MSNRDVATLAFRITGIYVLVVAVPTASDWMNGLILTAYPPPVMQQAFSTFPKPSIWWTVARGLGPALLLGLAIFLIVYCRQLATLLFREESTFSVKTRNLQLASLAYSVVGLVLIATGLPDLIGVMTQLGLPSWSIGEWVRALVQPTFCLCLGIVLFFGSDGLVLAWTRWRRHAAQRRTGKCLNCGYDLTGNTTGRCPECGTTFDHAAPPVPPAPRVMLTEEQMSGAERPPQAGQ